MPAAMTSATPRLVRETSAARAAGVTGAAGRAGRFAGAAAAPGVPVPASPPGAVRSGARATVPPGRPPPSHCRHSSAAPAATSTSGHTITSENRRPNARNVRRTLSARNAIPTAISIVPRLVRSHTGVAGASPAGRNTQASR